MDLLAEFGLFFVTILVMMLAFELGYRVVWTHRRTDREKEASVSAIAGSVLGLAAFMLAFTFGAVNDRYALRKELVRQEANAIGTAYLRTDILPVEDRDKSRQLLKDYLSLRLQAAHSREHILQKDNQSQSLKVHQELWALAVKNAKLDLNSDFGALYIESINNLIDVHTLRIAVVETHVPVGIWVVLYLLVFMGMIVVGYHAAIAGSGRSWVIGILVVSFSLVTTLISSLDRSNSILITVPQQALEDVQATLK